MYEEKIKFKRTLRSIGSSTNLVIPKELLNFLETKSNDSLTMIADKGKYGKYIAIYKEGE